MAVLTPLYLQLLELLIYSRLFQSQGIHTAVLKKFKHFGGEVARISDN